MIMNHFRVLKCRAAGSKLENRSGLARADKTNVVMIKMLAIPRTPPRNKPSPRELQYRNKKIRPKTAAVLSTAATGGRQAQAIALAANDHARNTNHRLGAAIESPDISSEPATPK